MTDNFNILSGGPVHKSRIISGYGEYTASGGVSNHIVWPNGTYVIPTSTGLSMTIQSTSVNDASGGTGIQTVEVHYLDVNLVEQSEIVSLAGTTSVGLSYANIRFVQCIHALTVGSGGYAAGDITIENSGNVYGQISTGFLRCASSVRMVPKNKIYYVKGFIGGTSSGSAAANVIIRGVATMIDYNILTEEGIFMPFNGLGLQDNSTTYNLPIAVPFPEGVAIGMSVTTDKAATITASWFGWEDSVSS